MLTIFLRIDAFTQKGVDTAAHCMMRTFGVSKGFVRYALLGVNIVLLTWECVYDVNKRAYGLAAFGLVMVGTWLWLQNLTRVQDERAERTGTVSPQDAVAWPWMRVFWWAFLGLAILVFDRSDPVSVKSLATSVVFLVCEYLRRTSPRPPARKRKQVLVPQPQRC
jgi:hypothetical protein